MNLLDKSYVVVSNLRSVDVTKFDVSEIIKEIVGSSIEAHLGLYKEIKTFVDDHGYYPEITFLQNLSYFVEDKPVSDFSMDFIVSFLTDIRKTIS